jgi:hypothetical protein
VLLAAVHDWVADRNGGKDMAEWIQTTPNGLSREELLSIHHSMRDQRNEHRSALFSQLQFYSTIISALLSFGVALSTFAIPHFYEHVANPSPVIRLGVFAPLLVLPLGALGMISFALQSLKKEYEKLLEYLTVEQKMEAALGLLGCMQVADPFPDRMPYPDDTFVSFPRWVGGSFEFKTSRGFVRKMAERKTVFYSPLKNTLKLLRLIDMVLILGIIGLAIEFVFRQ